MTGENRTSLAILAIAVLSLILAGVFAPQMGVEAKASEQAEYAFEDVPSWLFRLAALVPAPPEHPECHPKAARFSAWGLL